MRPTGRLHLGHYWGVLVNYLELQNQADCFFMVADLHALTTGELGKLEVGKNTRELLLDWLSVGVDPDKATLFVQSAVPEHCELTVLLSMFTSVGWLERNPTYKEQKQELGEKNTGSLGFLSYPVLQTVDVCLYKATHVPVGEDQKPHLEMGRELIRRFNATYKKNVFPEFVPLLTPAAKLPGLDGRKMSKSYGNTVELADTPEVIQKKVSRMLTDTKRPRREDPGHPENCPVFTYHQLFTPKERVTQIEAECRAATLSCFDDKKALADQIIAWSEPIRKKRAELEKEPAYIEEIIKKGNQKARNIASQTIKEVLDVMGFWPGSNR
jgi:tryptophanyl-tRNA synthetase